MVKSPFFMVKSTIFGQTTAANNPGPLPPFRGTQDAYNFDAEKIAELLQKGGEINEEELVVAWFNQSDIR